MEGFPKKGSSKLDKALRAATAGIALMGAVSATEVQAGEIPQSRQEQLQMQYERQARAFIDEVSAHELTFDDARGRHTLRIIIQEEYTAFAQKLGTTPSDPNLQKSVRAAIAAHGKANPALEILSSVVQHTPALSPKQQKGLQDFWKQMQ